MKLWHFTILAACHVMAEDFWTTRPPEASCWFYESDCLIIIQEGPRWRGGPATYIPLSYFNETIQSSSSYDGSMYHFTPCGPISDAIEPCDGHKGCKDEKYPLGENDPLELDKCFADGYTLVPTITFRRIINNVTRGGIRVSFTCTGDSGLSLSVPGYEIENGSMFYNFDITGEAACAVASTEPTSPNPETSLDTSRATEPAETSAKISLPAKVLKKLKGKINFDIEITEDDEL